MPDQSEAGGAHGENGFGLGGEVGDAVTVLDAVADGAVVGVEWGIGGGEDPFVEGEDAAGFENAVDLGVDGRKGGGVEGGFDGVDGVEGVVGEGDFLW